MKDKVKAFKKKEDGFFQLGPFIAVFTAVMLIVIPLFLFSYEKRIYDIQKEHLLTCVDVSIYTTYVSLETEDLSQYNFDKNKTKLQNTFHKKLKDTVKDKGNTIDMMAIKVKKFDYSSNHRKFSVDIEYYYQPVCLSFLDEKKVFLELDYHIPTDK